MTDDYYIEHRYPGGQEIRRDKIQRGWVVCQPPRHDYKGTEYLCRWPKLEFRRGKWHYDSLEDAQLAYKQWEHKTATEGEDSMTEENQLYQIAGTETYGYVLATNSKGQKVFEVKGTGEVKTVSPDQLEEVIPYSVGIKFNGNGTTYHYWMDEGSVKEGDLLFQQDRESFCTVVKINTKSKRANKRFEGVVVQTKPIK